MCIAVFMWQSHPLYPFLLLLNRDEFYSRPTQPLAWWPGDRILGGRDGQAGGTWLASTRDGRVAFITNFRECEKHPNPKSRGELPLCFLEGERLRHNFRELIDQYGESEFPIKEMVEKLMTNKIKDEESLLPGIHPPHREYPLSSIFVEADFPWGRYGTRSSSAFFVKSNGEVSFYEKYLDDVDGKWKEKMMTYQINGA